MGSSNAHSGGVSLASVLRTDELLYRTPRSPDYLAENRALIALGQCLTQSPDRVLEQITEAALVLCHAQSAGISLLTTDGEAFYWPAVAGQWSGYLGGGTPRSFGPCGTVLDEGTALLFSHPERYFTYLEAASPPIEEGLLLPFCVEGRAVGTLWIVVHDDGHCFDSEDLRVMTNLSSFAGAAYQVMASADAMRNSGISYGTLFDALPVGAFVCDEHGVIQRFNRRAAALWGREPQCGVERYCGSLRLFLMDGALLPHDRSPMVEVLRTGIATSNVEVQIERPDGTRLPVMANFSAVRNAQGHIVGTITCFDDVTAQVVSERRLAEQLALDRVRDAWVRNLIDAQEDERRRVARELHDEMGQHVTAFMLRLQTLREGGGERVDREIGELHRLVIELDSGVRRLARDLRPAALDDLGLLTALAHHVDEWSTLTGIEVDVSARCCDHRLPSTIETSLYRIIQEALTNVARHAQARHVSVILEGRDAEIVVIVEDDGCGFAAAECTDLRESGHLGLTGIRERAALLGGRVTIESGAGGSSLYVSVPIGSGAS
jgi:PAS domain S-box-containing protein